MPGRGPLLTRTRCPECGTVFRVTSEQLRLKAGKVRCGSCHGIFNAFDQLLPPETPSVASPVLAEETRQEPSAPAVPEAAQPEPEALPEVSAEIPVPPTDTGPDSVAMPVLEETQDPPWPEAEALEDEPDPEPEPAPPETPEQTTLAARQAGLVAVRELADSQAYNRWSAGPLADGGLSSFADDARPLTWPYWLAALLLLLTLGWQAAYHFRGDLVLRLPAAGAVFSALGVPVPLPRQEHLVAIETSDLQSDQARGLFVLNATLKNRAAFAQAWPDLELTLTDSADQVVARRVIAARDFLSAGAPRNAFPANGETAVRLWIDAKGIGAAGYRLYIFYP
ncbi:DUF3426 domain-containing protein [Azonexus caeni]|uniref:DUF3426 domain-containing protein n=1 Tax=Azonexus caeni TaxID=266126 RepID=UPI003A848F10